MIFHPIGQYKPRGTVKISCKTNDERFENIEYTKNGVPLSPATDPRILYGTDDTVTITGLDYKRDDGEYRCVVTNNRGKLQSLKKELKVKSK